MAIDWDRRLARWNDELDLMARVDEAHWVPLAVAEAEAGVSRSTLRTWYRQREIPSRIVDGPYGPQRLVPLDAVIERAGKSPRLQRRAERELSLEAQLALLQHRVDQLERRLEALDHPSSSTPEQRSS